MLEKTKFTTQFFLETDCHALKSAVSFHAVPDTVCHFASTQATQHITAFLLFFTSVRFHIYF